MLTLNLGSEKSKYVLDDTAIYPGHGTPVAALAGTKAFGIAKDVNLFNVKIAGCFDADKKHLISGTLTLALNDVIDVHKEKERLIEGFMGSVINFSALGPPKSPSLEKAFARLNKYGIPFIAGAGNDNKEMTDEEFWYCDLPGVLCVASMNSKWSKASHSNYGKAAVVAPGEYVYSVSPHKSVLTEEYARPYVGRSS